MKRETRNSINGHIDKLEELVRKAIVEELTTGTSSNDELEAAANVAMDHIVKDIRKDVVSEFTAASKKGKPGPAKGTKRGKKTAATTETPAADPAKPESAAA